MQMELFAPKSMTMMACVQPGYTRYLSGGQPVIDHAILGFSPGAYGVESVLDLASLQFGDVGRGERGRGLFVLEPIEQYVSRLNSFAESNNFEECIPTKRIRGAPAIEIAWLQRVARKVKERWENRNKEHWCGHCGAPPLERALRTCSKCHQAYYCDEEHQKAAWPFHKHFCRA